jgi:hypothetical protein
MSGQGPVHPKGYLSGLGRQWGFFATSFGPQGNRGTWPLFLVLAAPGPFVEGDYKEVFPTAWSPIPSRVLGRTHLNWLPPFSTHPAAHSGLAGGRFSSTVSANRNIALPKTL